jgi:CRP-like cAMP-binding protein
MPHPAVTGTGGSGNRLLAALLPVDFALLAAELEAVVLDQNAVLARAGDQVEHVFFPHSGAISLMIDMANGQTVATAAIGCEGAVGILSALGPSPSAITAIVHAAGTASRIPASRFRAAFNRSPAIRHALQAHMSAMLTHFQLGAACNALHPVEVRTARWLLNLSDHIDHDVLPLTQEALSQILGVRRTTVTLLMRNLRASGAIRSDRRGQIEIDRSRLAAVACECHETMYLELKESSSTNTARSRFLDVEDDEPPGELVARSGKEYSVTAHPTSVGNRLLAALPPADLDLLTPHFQKISFEPDAILVRSGDELDQVYFPHSGAIAFIVDVPNGQTVATTLMGREGALASLSCSAHRGRP